MPLVMSARAGSAAPDAASPVTRRPRPALPYRNDYSVPVGAAARDVADGAGEVHGTREVREGGGGPALSPGWATTMDRIYVLSEGA